MAFELVYTSAPSGIRSGSTGFCTVACTRGIDPKLMLSLESFSGYKAVFSLHDPNVWENPVSCAHYILKGLSGNQHVLSRVCFNGVDHTQRSNKLASHVVLKHAEAQQVAPGPASLFLTPGVFKEADWPIKAEMFPNQRVIAPAALLPRRCATWEAVTGDAGWAAILAKAFLDHPETPLYIIFNPLEHKNLAALVDEALMLLPSATRWGVTFNTYFVTLPAGVSCAWRFCLPDCEALHAARRNPQTLIIDLTQPSPLSQTPQENPLIEAARTGVLPAESLQEPTVPKSAVAAEAETEVQDAENATAIHSLLYGEEPSKPLDDDASVVAVPVANMAHREEEDDVLALPVPSQRPKKKPLGPYWLIAGLSLALLVCGVVIGVLLGTRKNVADTTKPPANPVVEEKIAEKPVEAAQDKPKAETDKPKEETVDVPPQAVAEKEPQPPPVPEPPKIPKTIRESEDLKPERAWMFDEKIRKGGETVEVRLGQDIQSFNDIRVLRQMTGSRKPVEIPENATEATMSFSDGTARRLVLKDGMLQITGDDALPEDQGIVLAHGEKSYYPLCFGEGSLWLLKEGDFTFTLNHDNPDRKESKKWQTEQRDYEAKKAQWKEEGSHGKAPEPPKMDSEERYVYGAEIVTITLRVSDNVKEMPLVLRKTGTKTISLWLDFELEERKEGKVFPLKLERHEFRYDRKNRTLTAQYKIERQSKSINRPKDVQSFETTKLAPLFLEHVKNFEQLEEDLDSMKKNLKVLSVTAHVSPVKK